MLRSLVVLLLLLPVTPAAATEAGWALLREGGQVVLMRHAYALGAADPPSFDIANCSTQRSLSDRGRQQARRIGSLFDARAAPVDRVLSSRLCRALETARLAFGERLVEEFPSLDPIAGDAGQTAQARTDILERVAGHDGGGNLVLVTDLANIEALTGRAAREGEALVVARSGELLHVLARIVFN